jgi:demethylmenaquinone methyltransferase/2-methoxy-6-polyprenyl-1,4-benzoquinol methylase
MTEVKSHGFFNILAPAYDILARITMLGQYDRLRNRLLEKIDTTNSKRILDMASGTGYLAQGLSHVDLVCTDISIEMLKRARSKAIGDFIVADAHRLPFKDGVFDGAVSSFAMHEITRPGIALNEMFRTLQPGGNIAVMDVVLQTRFVKKVLLQIFHTFVEMRTARYMSLDGIKQSFHAAEDFNVECEMFGLVAVVWGRKGETVSQRSG